MRPGRGAAHFSCCQDTSTFFACAKKVTKKAQPILMLNISFIELSSAKIGV
jgi:hypothetical protein